LVKVGRGRYRGCRERLHIRGEKDPKGKKIVLTIGG